MAAKPDTEKGSLTRSVLAFFGTSTGLVLVCVLLNATGIVKWKDVVELLHGQPKQDVAAKEKSETPPPKDDNKGKVNSDIAKTPDKKSTDRTPVVVTPTNSAPTIKATPATINYASGELTKKIELAIDDEEADRVTVVATPVSAGPIAADGLKVAGSGATRFLDVTINPEKWGTGTVRLTATDPHKLAAETTVRVTVPPPALSIVEIPDVSVIAGVAIPTIALAVEDLARKPGKVTLTCQVSDSMFPDKSVTLDPEKKQLQLAPKAGLTGTANITLFATADDGRVAKRSFKVTVSPKPQEPLREGRPAKLLVALVEGGLHLDAKGLNSVLGSPALYPGMIVTVKMIRGNRCAIEFTSGKETITGWVDTKILVAVE